MADDLLPEPQPDRFEHESPIRAFTEWNVTGSYAIGKGFRPSVAHLPTYLDAMERKEGWQLVQILYADDHERRSLVFHRMIPPVVKLDFPMVTDKEQAKRLADHFRDTFPRIARMWEPDRLDNVEFPAADEGVPIPVVGDIAEPDEDDPVNPKHYNGTECAEIGELLTPNAYQTLKYCWRLGEKDDPVIELGKAIWYWKREMALRADTPAYQIEVVAQLGESFVEDRIGDRSQFTQNIARMLWHGYTLGMRADHHLSILEALEEELHHRSPDQ